MYDLQGKRVWVAGHRGMVGSAIVRRLAAEDCTILTVERDKVDLLDQAAVHEWVRRERPQAVFLAAARVGGILANDTRPADFLYENLMIEANIIHASVEAEVEKLLFLGSSCIYPKFAPQPVTEDALLTGPLETTNQWYAIAKIAGLKLCQAYRRQLGRDFISAMPTNLYGPGDNYNLLGSHVIPALIRKAHDVKIGASDRFVIWGTGKPRREFLHADDCADACVFLMRTYSDQEHVNVGSGTDLPIMDLARLVCEVVGIAPRFEHDLARADGTPRKLMSNARLAAMGWQPRIPLEKGIRLVYEEFRRDHAMREIGNAPAKALRL